MILLQYSIYILLLLVGDYVCSLSVRQRANAIDDALKSYESAYVSKEAEEDGLGSRAFPKSKVTRRMAAPTDSNIESNDNSEYNSIPRDFEDYSASSADTSDENDERKGPPDHVIPFSEHEDPKEPSTRPNYTAPGEWAKPPANRNISLDFVPSKLYAQVRGTHTVKRLPRDQAIESAKTEEERENAARLKEVVKISKSNTVYTEEGYEDAAYDHAGQIRDAKFHEGYDKKLNDNVERKKIDGKGLGHTNSLLHPRKKSQKSRNSSSDKSDGGVTEAIQEARVLNRQVLPRIPQDSASKSNDSLVDPKSIVLHSILQLEHDLKKVSYEHELSSTEPYVTTSTYLPPLTEPPTHDNKIEYETTTLKPTVYTIRSRKFTSTLPNAYPKPKRRRTSDDPEVHESSNNGQVYSNDSNASNGHFSWRYLTNPERRASTLKSSPDYHESRTSSSPIMTDPMALSTANGHGPYLPVVTERPSTLSPSPPGNQVSKTTINYVSIRRNNVSVPSTSTPPSLNHQPFVKTEARKTKGRNKSIAPRYAQRARYRSEQPPVHDERTVRGKNFKLPNDKSSPNHAKVLEYLQNEKANYFDYYGLAEPLNPSYALVAYPDNLHEAYGNAAEHWSVTQGSDPGSAYPAREMKQSPWIDLSLQGSAIPVTKLLPPAPLSTSEYSSFQTPSRTSESMPGSMISYAPIIAAIHRHKSDRKVIPFFFRRKRSLGPSREWEILQREQRVQHREGAPDAAANARLSDGDKSDKSDKVAIENYPGNFEDLLSEAPIIASREINKEIASRFNNSSRAESDEQPEEYSSYESADDASDDTSGRLESDDDDSREKHRVRIAVPELDFGKELEEDKAESTTPRIDIKKYPFYENEDITKSQALKYIINPMEMPRKTLGGMEFYESRDLRCDEIDPSLEKLVPEEEELARKQGPRRSEPRLRGLGNKVDCYKAKYFDRNPLDNPLFLEEGVESPSPPLELDAKKFASRISHLSAENEEYIIPRGPKYPEDFALTKGPVKFKKTLSNFHGQSNNDNNYNAPRFDSNNNPSSSAQANYPRPRKPYKTMVRDKSRKRPSKSRSTSKRNKKKSRVPPEYQRQVYEDVMGTIMNLENMYETRKPTTIRLVPTRTAQHLRDYASEQESGEYEKPRKHKQTTIDGLIPPPQYIFNTVPANNKYAYYKWRDARIFKRSAESENAEKVLNETSNRLRDIVSKSDIGRKSAHHVLKATPTSERAKRKRKTDSTILETSTTTRTVYTINDRAKSIDRPTGQVGKFDRFIANDNRTLSIDSRRNEPRYNIPKTINVIINDTAVTTASTLTGHTYAATSPQSSTDPSFSRSTLVPVIVRPDANFTARIPQESKTQYTKQRLETNNNGEDGEVNLTAHIDTIDDLDDENNNTENLNEAYLADENKIGDEAGKQRNDKLQSNFTSEPDSHEHHELLDFLKGDPPGYEKTFQHETTTDHEAIKSNESVQNTKSERINSKEEEAEEEEDGVEEVRGQEQEDKAEQSNEEDSKETFEGEGTSNDSEEDLKDNNDHQLTKDEEENANAQTTESEPFTRYSSRPHSPSENYEDPRYSELGPRVNKPYFYHPPFDTPAYETYVLGKSVDHSNDEDWNHSDETEDHETYVFPWDNDKDEDEEGNYESRHSSVLGRYEYPWERRERIARERRRKEKLQRKYGKNYLDSQEEDEQEEEEATNSKPIYIPSRRKHRRNKKDVNYLKGNSEQQPVVQFTGKYQSRVIKDPNNNEQMLATITKSDEVGTIVNYYENSSSAAPSTSPSHTREESAANDKYSLNTTSGSPHKQHNVTRAENTTPASSSKSPTFKSVRGGRASVKGPTTSTTSTPKHRIRIRSRKKETTISINSANKVAESVNESARPTRRRGRRDKDNSTNITSPPLAVPKPPPPARSIINRRRGRTLAISTGSPRAAAAAAAPTPRTLGIRRRRPFKVQSRANESSDLPKIGNVSATTLPPPVFPHPTSTGRTVEHRSRLSKEEIITKTFYPDSQEDQEDEDEVDEVDEEDEDEKEDVEDVDVDVDVDVKENSSNHHSEEVAGGSNTKSGDKINVGSRGKPKNESQDGTKKKKETVEKVTITMKETPNHVYRTKEIDKDGVRGKFVSITANDNNNSTGGSRGKDELGMRDAEMEELKRRMNALSSFDGIKQDSEDLVDEPSEAEGVENYVVGNEQQKLPLPTTRRESKVEPKDEDAHLSDHSSSEEYEDVEENEDNSGGDKDNESGEDEGSDSRNINHSEKGKEESDKSANDTSSEESEKNASLEDNKTARNNTEHLPLNVIKDPNSRRYFYVERR